MFAAKEEGGIWRKYSTGEVKDIVHKLAAGLAHLGISANDMSIEGRDKIAVISANRPEWMLLDLAVQMTGAVLVPIYPTLSVNELEFVLNDAAVKLVFTGDEDLYNKVQSNIEKVKNKRDQLKKENKCMLIETPTLQKNMHLQK